MVLLCAREYPFIMTVYLVTDEEIDLLVNTDSADKRQEIGKIMRIVTLQAVNVALFGLIRQENRS